MNKNYCFTLCWNIVSEIEKSTKSLYELNDSNDFIHIIIDLGFPIEKGNIIPDDINQAKSNNSKALKELSFRFGSLYAEMDNVGVSQNWQAIYQWLCKEMKFDNTDILIGVDPDERVNNTGWVNAIGNILRLNKDNIGLVSLMLNDHWQGFVSHKYQYDVKETIFPKYKYYILKGLINWALIGLSGKFLNDLGVIPYPLDMPIYGGIESALLPYFDRLNYKWCITPDYKVSHTDSVLLLRQWKDCIIFKRQQYGQLTFENWLDLKKKGKI
jgi:hypothetical protein